MGQRIDELTTRVVMTNEQSTANQDGPQSIRPVSSVKKKFNNASRFQVRHSECPVILDGIFFYRVAGQSAFLKPPVEENGRHARSALSVRDGGWWQSIIIVLSTILAIYDEATSLLHWRAQWTNGTALRATNETRNFHALYYISDETVAVLFP